MNSIAIFASGSGTNAENIIRFFRTHTGIEVKLVIANRKNAGVIDRAEKWGVEAMYLPKDEFLEGTKVIQELDSRKITHIVLAGFLLLIPKILIEHYPGRILNIHPALLPKYGGKGMYGSHVHEAVIANGEVESGITIHMVNERYDDGAILFQARCEIDPQDSPESLAKKIHALEYEHYPKVIQEVIQNQ